MAQRKIQIYASRSNLHQLLRDSRSLHGALRRIRAVALEIPLDETDQAILRALQENGRRPYRDIAREVRREDPGAA